MDELTEKWTGTDLAIYVRKIREEKENQTFSEILDGRRLRLFLSNPDGSLILRDAIDIISSELTEIFRLVVDDPRKNIDKIVTSSDRYRAALNIVNRWITRIKLGEHHEKELKKIVKKRKG